MATKKPVTVIYKNETYTTFVPVLTIVQTVLQVIDGNKDEACIRQLLKCE